ncbi:hypothetical protein GCM10011594_17860 [Nakamurella endophytica]|uniref:Peptidase A2 domain-containing protein n=1 Tax=Nakamurella endophytica TaxID=1748367 RepID=A0A917WEW8_9ACTN|nr:hypothetical protein GCM10011594_17860 [Nakamurella endophytica]
MTVPMTVVRSKDGAVMALAVVSVAGKPYAFIVDTGASVTILDSKVVEEAGLQTAGAKITGSGAACPTVSQPVHLQDWSIGGEAMPPATAPSTSIAFAGKKFHGLTVGGLLGADVFRAFGSVRLDYAGGSLRLGGPVDAGKQTVPILLAGGNGSTEIVASVRLHGTATHMLVDTGASRTTVDSTFADRVGLQKVGKQVKLSSVSCTSSSQEVTVDQLTAGTVDLPTVTGVSVGTENAKKSNGHLVGLIGSDVLSTYKTVTFDYTDRKIVLAS